MPDNPPSPLMSVLAVAPPSPPPVTAPEVTCPLTPVTVSALPGLALKRSSGGAMAPGSCSTACPAP
jgi:hypothetical protein